MTRIMGEPPPLDPLDTLDPIIVVPYIDRMLHEETVESVRQAGYPYALWPLDPDDPFAYATLLAGLWNRGDDLIIVEQDMIVPPGAIKAMIKCEALWCSHTYDCDNDVPAYGLGLCKFSKYVQTIRPSLGEQAARNYRGVARRQHWTTLNERIIYLMEHWGYKVHLHEPEARHLHYYGNSDAAAG